MTKISTLSDQPFSFPSKNVIFGVEITKFFIPAQNFGIFASLSKGMDIFYLKWAWNECLHLRTSEMSIDMGRHIVHWSYIGPTTCFAISGPVKEWLIGVIASPAPATPLKDQTLGFATLWERRMTHLKSIVYSGEFARTAATTSPCSPPFSQ